jgi:hypothetical protein
MVLRWRVSSDEESLPTGRPEWKRSMELINLMLSNSAMLFSQLR